MYQKPHQSNVSLHPNNQSNNFPVVNFFIEFCSLNCFLKLIYTLRASVSDFVSVCLCLCVCICLSVSLSLSLSLCLCLSVCLSLSLFHFITHTLSDLCCFCFFVN